MATLTANYKFITPVGSDQFNPLTDSNPNWTSADNIIKKVENQSIAVATEVKSGSVHAITVPEGAGNMFRFVATSKFGAQDTCTVNGTQVSTLMPNGTTLPEGGWVINSNVLCCMTGTVMTVYTTIGGESGSIDADTLDGHDASYFATDSALNEVKTTAEAASRIANSASTTAANAASVANTKTAWVELWSNPNPTASAATFTATMTNVPSNAKMFVIMAAEVNSKDANLTPNFYMEIPATEGVIRCTIPGGHCRPFTKAGNTLTFANGIVFSSYTTNGNFSYSQSVAIPMKIYALV